MYPKRRRFQPGGPRLSIGAEARNAYLSACCVYIHIYIYICVPNMMLSLCLCKKNPLRVVPICVYAKLQYTIYCVVAVHTAKRGASCTQEVTQEVAFHQNHLARCPSNQKHCRVRLSRCAAASNSALNPGSCRRGPRACPIGSRGAWPECLEKLDILDELDVLEELDFLEELDVLEELDLLDELDVLEELGLLH